MMPKVYGNDDDATPSTTLHVSCPCVTAVDNND